MRPVEWSGRSAHRAVHSAALPGLVFPHVPLVYPLLMGKLQKPTPCLEEPQSYPGMAWTQKPMEDASCALRMCREPGTLGVCLLLWQSVVPGTRAGEIWCYLGTSKGLEEPPFLSRLLTVFGWCDIEDTAISRRKSTLATCSG